MKKLMNLSLSLALALTLCTAVAPVVDFGGEEVTEEEGIMPLSDMEPDLELHFQFHFYNRNIHNTINF